MEEFLNAFWGYDNTRVWQIQAILPTPAQGVSRVLILVKPTILIQHEQEQKQFPLLDSKLNG